MSGTSGNIARPVESLDFSISRGLTPNFSTGITLGYNLDVDIGTETIWSSGGVWVPQTSATTYTIVSTSVNDTLSGSGAQTILLDLIDSNRDRVLLPVTLNGTTPVVTTQTGFGINAAIVTSGINQGDISITSTTGGFGLQALIKALDGISNQAIYFTPNNHVTYLRTLRIILFKSVGGASSIIINGWLVDVVNNTKGKVYNNELSEGSNAVEDFTLVHPFPIPENNYLYFEAVSTEANNRVRFAMSTTLEKL